MTPVNADADSELGPRAPHRCLGVAPRHKFPRRETDVRVIDLDVIRVPAKLPPYGVHEGAARLRVDAISLSEHFEVQLLEAAAVLHFRLPIFVWTLPVARGRHVGRGAFPGLSLTDIKYFLFRFA